MAASVELRAATRVSWLRKAFPRNVVDLISHVSMARGDLKSAYVRTAKDVVVPDGASPPPMDVFDLLDLKHWCSSRL